MPPSRRPLLQGASVHRNASRRARTTAGPLRHRRGPPSAGALPRRDQPSPGHGPQDGASVPSGRCVPRAGHSIGAVDHACTIRTVPPGSLDCRLPQRLPVVAGDPEPGLHWSGRQRPALRRPVASDTRSSWSTSPHHRRLMPHHRRRRYDSQRPVPRRARPAGSCSVPRSR